MTVARGADGAGLARRLYRRSPVRWLWKVAWGHRGLRPNDVFLAAYPRSGSGWTRWLLHELLVGDASWPAISRSIPYVDRSRNAPALLPGGGRLIKTHFPYRSNYRRAIHLVRDPRDVALSYFRFQQRARQVVLRPGDDEAASLDSYLTAFLRGRVDAHGTWQAHLLSWLEATERGRADVLRLRYEDMRADTPAALVRIAGWLGVPLDPARAQEITARCSKERMRADEAYTLANVPGAFAYARDRSISAIGEGRPGRWREVLNDEQRRRFAVMARGLDAMGYPV